MTIQIEWVFVLSAIRNLKSKDSTPPAHPRTESHADTWIHLLVVGCVTLFNIFTPVELFFSLAIDISIASPRIQRFKSHCNSLLLLFGWTYCLGLFLSVHSDALGLGQKVRSTYFSQLLPDITAAGAVTRIRISRLYIPAVHLL